MRPARRTGSIAAAALAAAALAPGAASAAPRVHQLVVFKDGSAKQKKVTTEGTKVRVGRKRCGVPAATALAALVRSRVAALKIKDYGDCSPRPSDAGGLYVRQIRRDRARGQNGWVYKVGNRVASAGAADASGPFGRGRLKRGARVTWFYCRLSNRTNSCQRTLGVKARALGGGRLRATVRAYDDNGRSRLVRGATVRAGGKVAKTNARGAATLQLEPGRRRMWASAKGRVRSFEETVVVR